MASLRAAALALLLAGCADPGPGGAFDTYLQRLARPLETAAAERRTPTLAPPPRPAKLRLPLAPGRLDALDFLELRGCQLQVTVGKRNSSLGRLAAPSQELLLELEFLRLAPACIRHLEDNAQSALADTLRAALASKREELPARIYNATLASEEFRDLWQAPQTLNDYPESTSSAPIAALATVNGLASQWLAGDYAADNRKFELLLSEVTRGDAGALLAALKMQQAALQAANSMLQSRLQRGPLCRGPLVPDQVDILKNVVEKFFIRGIQPWSATLRRREHALLPQIRQLEQQLAAVLPPRYRQWKTRREALLTSASDAPRRHVEQIQSLLADCRQATSTSPLAPAQPTSE